MTKKAQEQVPAKVERSQELVVLKPEEFKPAAMIGVQNNLMIDPKLLPEEFQGQALETLDTTLPPTVKWINPGNFVAGVYEGKEEGVGPNKSNLYAFDAKGKKFSIWGTTTIDRIFESGQIEIGDMLLITYIGSIETDFNPCKMFDVKKAKVKKA